jgi:CHAD domain-containing protein
MRDDAVEWDLGAALRVELTAALEALGRSADGDGVHRCRVALKRARAIARAARKAAPGSAALLNREARAIMQRLSPARDRTVMAACARREARAAKPRAALALRALAEGLEAEEAREERGADLNQALANLSALMRNWPETTPAQTRAGVRAIAGKARSAFKHACSGDTDDRHEWRKREKDRLYIAELSGPAWPTERRRRIRRTRRLTQALGAERDVLLTIDALKHAHGLKGGRAAALKHLDEVHTRLARRANRLGRKLHANRA